MNKFKLNDLFHLTEDEMRKYKIHLAAYNGYEHPLDVFARDREEWKGWNEWRGGKDDFNREFILGLIPDYHRADKFVFGGVFKVIERYDDWQKTEVGYKVELTKQFDSLIGRLVVGFSRYQGLRGRAFLLENFIESMSISEILENPYEGEVFPGYDNVKIDFSSLELLVRNQKTDWRVALENVKGVYLIVDKCNGKKYVGSAYGEDGLLQRWTDYIHTHHGGNKKMIELLKAYPERYHRFQFSVLQILPKTLTNDSVISIENLYKKKLMTIEFGLNDN